MSDQTWVRDHRDPKVGQQSLDNFASNFHKYQHDVLEDVESVNVG